MLTYLPGKQRKGSLASLVRYSQSTYHYLPGSPMSPALRPPLSVLARPGRRLGVSMPPLTAPHLPAHSNCRGSTSWRGSSRTEGCGRDAGLVSSHAFPSLWQGRTARPSCWTTRKSWTELSPLLRQSGQHLPSLRQVYIACEVQSLLLHNRREKRQREETGERSVGEVVPCYDELQQTA